METKHAPLPWVIHAPDLAITSVRPDAPDLPLCIGQMYHIINYGDLRDRELTAANAAFIVRACNAHYELVEALESAIEALDYAATHLDNQTIHGHRVLRAVVNDTRAALAKAKD